MTLNCNFEPDLKETFIMADKSCSNSDICENAFWNWCKVNLRLNSAVSNRAIGEVKPPYYWLEV